MGRQLTWPTAALALLLVLLIWRGSAVLAAEPTASDREAAVLTPKPPETPRINGPRVYGERPGKPFFFHIPTTGQRPITFSAEGLPEGLSLDSKTGTITGRAGADGRFPVKLTATNSHGSDSATLNIVIGDTICLTPPMGWNSWNYFHRSVDDAKVRAAADAMVSSGLIDHGWTYINIDDCWQGKRDEQGRIRPNEKFPDMKALSDYIHGKGLKFGTYSSPGPTTCAGFTGSYKHEEQDVLQYAEWGVDYVKYDWCSYSRIAPQRTEALYVEAAPQVAEQIKSLLAERATFAGRRAAPASRPSTGPASRPRTGGFARGRALSPEDRARLKAIDEKLDQLIGGDKRKQLDLVVLQEPYRVFHEALAKADRDIVYSLCQYGNGDVWTWGAQVGGNCWRTTGDIRAAWDSIDRIGFSQNGHEPYAGPGHWNDPDMLEVGNGRLTPDEMYAHFSLWSLLASPLLIGCDMSRMDPLTVSIFSNDEVIAVNQDALGKQAKRVGKDGETEVWAKPMSDGSLAVGLFNRGAAEASCAARWSDLGLSGSRMVRDLWRQKDLGSFEDSFSTPVRSHGVVLVRISASPRR